MPSFKAGLRNELLLMLYRRKTVIFFIFCALAPPLLAAPLGRLQNNLGVSAVIGSSFPIGMLGLYTMFLIPLFIFFTVADLFPGELASRTLKLALLRPITRFKLFTAKTAALGIALLALLLVLGISTYLGGAVFGSAGGAAGDTVKAYLAAFVPMLALGTAAVFLSQLFKSASSSLIVAILVYAALRILPVFVHNASVFAVTSYTDWHMLWLSGSVSVSRLLISSLFLAANLVLFFSLGFAMFERKEV